MINTEQTSFFEKPGQIPLAARLRPEDFDAVFRLLSQSFPAGAQGTVDCADLLSMAMMIDSGAWIITYADLGQQAFPLRLTSIENPEHFAERAGK